MTEHKYAVYLMHLINPFSKSVCIKPSKEIRISKAVLSLKF